ncbi:MAG: FG-GAP-like repeat-containing protein, partial [Limisphaerales bacterium]
LVLLLADGTVNVYTNTHNPSAPFVAPPSIANLLGQPVPQGSGIGVADIDYDGRLDVLVSDANGRIWEFHRNVTGSSYTLTSKVWGGSGVGFAQRLTIAAGDINGDGDVDLIGGFAQGGLLALRDPHYSVPANIRAAGGAMSVFLEWDPDRQSRIAGYNVYRSYPDTNAFAMVNASRVVVPRYEDAQALLRATNFYRVTAVTGVIYPGNSVPQYIESRPSEIVTTVPGGVMLWMSDYYGAPGGATVLQINTPLASAISGTNLGIHVLYDPAVVIPASQVDSSKPTVERTALTQNLVIADNGATANGEIIITGISGNILTGTGNLFDINFRVASGVAVGTTTTNVISSVALSDTSGNSVPVTIQGVAQFTAASNYFPGDVNGDGTLSQADFDLAMQLAVGQRAATPQEIAAGDLNGNGVIDKDDASMLLSVITGQSPNPQ